MIVIKFLDTLKKLLHMDVRQEGKTRTRTKSVIKKYGKTLRRLSYE